MEKQVFKGRHTFDGIFKINLKGKEYTIQTDEGGYYLRKADPNKEIILLAFNHCQENEVDTGFVSFKEVKEAPYGVMACLKASPKNKSYSVFLLDSIIAWGYVDGGIEDEEVLHYCQRTRN